MPFNSITIPEDFICSITGELMTDPVFTADGETYERRDIQKWLTEHNTSPNTNEVLEHKHLVPNRKLKSQICQLVDLNRPAFEKELIDAAKNGEIELIETILNLGIKIDTKDKSGRSPLFWAIAHGHNAAMNLLVTKGANIHETLAFKDTQRTKIKSKGEQLDEKINEAEQKLSKIQIYLQKLSIKHAEDVKRKNNCAEIIKPIEYKLSRLNQLQYYLRESEKSDKDRDERARNCSDYQRRREILSGPNNIYNRNFRELYIAICEEFNITSQLYYRYGVYKFDRSRNIDVSQKGIDEIANLAVIEQQLVTERAVLAGINEQIALLTAFTDKLNASAKQVRDKLVQLKTDRNSQAKKFTETLKNKEPHKIDYALLALDKDIAPLIKLTDTFTIEDMDKLDNSVFKQRLENNLHELDKLIKLTDSKDNVQELQRFKPIHFAAQCGNVYATTLLLINQVNPNERDTANRTPLYYAITNNKMAVAQCLLNKSASINSIDGDNNTALHIAAQLGNTSLIKYLINKGINYLAVNNQQLTAIDIAMKNGDIATGEFIKNEGTAYQQRRLISLEQTVNAQAMQIKNIDIAMKNGDIATGEFIKNEGAAYQQQRLISLEQTVSAQAMQIKNLEEQLMKVLQLLPLQSNQLIKNQQGATNESVLMKQTLFAKPSPISANSSDSADISPLLDLTLDNSVNLGNSLKKN